MDQNYPRRSSQGSQGPPQQNTGWGFGKDEDQSGNRWNKMNTQEFCRSKLNVKENKVFRGLTALIKFRTPLYGRNGKFLR